MKKQLLFVGLLFGFAFSVNAQREQLQAENFNSLTVGNLGTDITGTTPGQGGFYLRTSNGPDGVQTTSTNAAASNAQIVNSGSSLSLRIEGPDGDNGSRFLWKDDLRTAWGSRNETIVVELDVNPGGATTSSNTFGVNIYDATFNKILAGFSINASTKEVFLVCYCFASWHPTGNQKFSIRYPGLRLPENQWSRIGISYTKVLNGGSGEAKIKVIGPGIEDGMWVITQVENLNPAEVDIVAFSGNVYRDINDRDPIVTNNTSSATMDFDNIVIRAGGGPLLSIDDFSSSKFSVYPNPSNGLVTISNDLNSALTSVSFADLNGRTVKTVELNGDASAQVNISELAAGVYMMNISSDRGTITKKIVKN